MKHRITVAAWVLGLCMLLVGAGGNAGADAFHIKVGESWNLGSEFLESFPEPVESVSYTVSWDQRFISLGQLAASESVYYSDISNDSIRVTATLDTPASGKVATVPLIAFSPTGDGGTEIEISNVRVVGPNGLEYMGETESPAPVVIDARASFRLGFRHIR